jgi:putative ABC transport system permease protein
MRLLDNLSYTSNTLARYRTRTGLILLAMAIGVASIIILTSLGEAARKYVVGQFSSLGTNLLIVIPGRSETTGGAPSMIVGETPRDLTLDDAKALMRSGHVRRIAPVMIGSASISWQQRDREAPVLGSTAALLDIRHWSMSRGRFLPPGEIDHATPVCVLGIKLYKELFGTETALGKWIRIGDRRFRVIGILASEGRSIGVDVQDLIIVPVASAQALFNSPSLFRIMVEAKSREAIPKVDKHILDTIQARHQGERDITVITQDAILSTFDRILNALTLTVGGIAAISLIVAGILIMNIMLVSVSQRTAEIGLLKALGAPGKQIIILFLSEAIILSLSGACLGVVVGVSGNWVIGYFYPNLQLGAPWWAVTSAVGIAVTAGLAFGAFPARRAARLDPVLALSHK